MLLIFPLKNHMVIYFSFKHNLKDRWSFSSWWISKKKIKKRLWWRMKGNIWNYPESVSEIRWNSFFFNDFKNVLTPCFIYNGNPKGCQPSWAAILVRILLGMMLLIPQRMNHKINFFSEKNLIKCYSLGPGFFSPCGFLWLKPGG